MQAVGVERGEFSATGGGVDVVDGGDLAPVVKHAEVEARWQAPAGFQAEGLAVCTAALRAGVGTHARGTAQVELFGRVKVAVGALNSQLPIERHIVSDGLVAPQRELGLGKAALGLGAGSIRRLVGRARQVHSAAGQRQAGAVGTAAPQSVEVIGVECQSGHINPVVAGGAQVGGVVILLAIQVALQAEVAGA